MLPLYNRALLRTTLFFMLFCSALTLALEVRSDVAYGIDQECDCRLEQHLEPCI